MSVILWSCVPWETGKFTSELLRYGMHFKGSHSVTCTVMHLSANGINDAFAFLAETGKGIGPHFTDSGG